MKITEFLKRILVANLLTFLILTGFFILELFNWYIYKEYLPDSCNYRILAKEIVKKKVIPLCTYYNSEIILLMGDINFLKNTRIVKKLPEATVVAKSKNFFTFNQGVINTIAYFMQRHDESLFELFAKNFYLVEPVPDTPFGLTEIFPYTREEQQLYYDSKYYELTGLKKIYSILMYSPTLKDLTESEKFGYYTRELTGHQKRIIKALNNGLKSVFYEMNKHDFCSVIIPALSDPENEFNDIYNSVFSAIQFHLEKYKDKTTIKKFYIILHDAWLKDPDKIKVQKACAAIMNNYQDFGHVLVHHELRNQKLKIFLVFMISFLAVNFYMIRKKCYCSIFDWLLKVLASIGVFEVVYTFTSTGDVLYLFCLFSLVGFFMPFLVTYKKKVNN